MKIVLRPLNSNRSDSLPQLACHPYHDLETQFASHASPFWCATVLRPALSIRITRITLAHQPTAGHRSWAARANHQICQSLLVSIVSHSIKTNNRKRKRHSGHRNFAANHSSSPSQFHVLKTKREIRNGLGRGKPVASPGWP